MDRLDLTIQTCLGDAYPLVAVHVAADGTRRRHDGSVAIDRDRLTSLLLDQVAYGLALGQAVFQGSLAETFRQAVDGRTDERLRVTLSIEDPDLRNLRWERLTAPFTGTDWHFLAVDRRTPFSLSPPQAIDSRYAPVEPKDWRALVLVASPECPAARDCGRRPGCPESLATYELEPFDVAEAVSRVSAALHESDDRAVPCDVLAWQTDGALGLPTLPALKEALINSKPPYAFLHVVCHGEVSRATGDTVLYLADKQNCVQGVTGSELIAALSGLGSDLGLPNLIFLSSCQTATSASVDQRALPGLAERLVRELGVPAVIAMTERIQVEAALDLTRCFYTSLREHGEVDRALADARHCIDTKSQDDAVIPSLYSRFGDRPLFSLVPGGKPLTTDEKRQGRQNLAALIETFAPVLRPELDKLKWADDGAEIADQDGNATLLALNALAWETFNLRFDSVARLDVDAVLDGKQSGVLPLVVKNGEAVCPFRGLEAFREEDSAFFFGREDLICRLVEQLDQHPFLPVLGPSGCGKSSLVLAGLLPFLARIQPGLTWASRPVRPGSDPVAALGAHLRETPNPGLIVVDQFEEVFSLCHDDDKRRKFFARLLALTQTCKVLLTMRADFWGDCAPYAELREAMREHQILIAPMTPGELRRATEEQAAAVGMTLEPGLGATIFADVAEEPGAMPLLQYALLELWNRRHGLRLRVEEYQKIGGLKGAIATSADALFASLADPGKLAGLSDKQRRVRDIFVRLTKIDDEGETESVPRDTRRRVPLTELVPDKEDLEPTRELVKLLADARLVVTDLDDVTREPEVEVAHEALIRSWPRLRGWLNADRASLLLRDSIREAAQDWDSQNREESYLARGRRLEDAERLKTHPWLELNTLERDYIAASVAQREQDRLRRVISIGLATCILIALAIVAFALFQQRNEAEAQRIQADLQTNYARALTLVGQIPVQLANHEYDRAALLAGQAYRFSQAAENRARARVDERLRETLQTLYIDRMEGVDTGGRDIAATGFSSDGRRLVSAREGPAVQTWDLKAGDFAANQVSLAGSQGFVSAAAFSPDLRWLALAGYDGTGAVHLWDLTAGDPTLSFAVFCCNSGAVTAIEFSPDGNWLAYAGVDGTVRVWNLAAGDPRSDPVELFGHEYGVNALAFDSHGQWLASAGYDRTVRLWDLSDLAAEPTVFRGHQEEVNALAFDPNGRWLVSASGDGTMRLWNLADFAAEPVVLAAGDWIIDVAFDPNGRWLASAARDRRVTRWDLTVADLAASRVDLSGGQDGGWAVSFSQNGRWLASARGDEGTRLWDLTSTDSTPVDLSSNGFRVKEVVFSPDGHWLYSSNGREIQLWDLQTADVAVEPGDLPVDAWVTAVAFESEGQLLASGDADEKVRLWNPADLSTKPTELGGHEGAVNDVAFETDGQRLASAGEDGTVRLWNQSNLTAAPVVLRGHEGAVEQVAFVSGGRWLASVGADGTLRRWDLTDLTAESAVLSRDFGWVNAMAFSPDGRWLAVSEGGVEFSGPIRVWDLFAGDPFVDPTFAPITLHEDAVVEALAFDPKGRWLATASWNVIRLWNLTDLAAEPFVLRGHAGMINALAFEAEGWWLASAGEDGTVRLWDLADLTAESIVLRRHDDEVTDVAFEPGGRRLISVDRGGRVLLWRTIDEMAETVCELVGRNLDSEEWQEFVGAEATYDSTCLSLLPVGGELPATAVGATPTVATDSAVAALPIDDSSTPPTITVIEATAT